MCCSARTRHATPFPRRGKRPEYEGGWRAEKRKILMARALRHAGASRRANHGVFRQRALLSSGPSRIECADRAVSQLLAGTPSGPGGSSAAARVPRCDEARRRRTSSRFTTPHDRAPQWTRWVQSMRGLGGGGYAGIAHPLSSSRRKPRSRATRAEPAALDTGFAGMTELGFRLRRQPRRSDDRTRCKHADRL